MHYRACISRGKPPEGYHAGRADVVAMRDFTDLENMRVFMCGHADMVRTLKKTVYIRGADLKDIYADPFIMKNLRQTPRINN